MVGGSGGCRCGLGKGRAERAWEVGEGKRWKVDKGVNVRCGEECGTGRGGDGRWTWLDSRGGRMRTKVVVEGGGGKRRWDVQANDGGEGLVGSTFIYSEPILSWGERLAPKKKFF